MTLLRKGEEGRYSEALVNKVLGIHCHLLFNGLGGSNTRNHPPPKSQTPFFVPTHIRIDFSNYCSTKVKTEILFRAMYRMAELGIEAHKPI